MKEVTRDQLKKLIEEKGDYILIDVREPSELMHGTIPTSKNIPLSEFTQALDMTPEEFHKKYGFTISKTDQLIFYCRSGNRSAQSTSHAEKKGFNAANYKGSILDWSEIDPNVKKY